MNKEEVRQRVFQNGKPLDFNNFEWDENANTFSSNECGLVLNFEGIALINFNAGIGCIFKTGSYCTFNTKQNCTFITGFNCVFNTGSDCFFITDSDCVFITYSSCEFNAKENSVIVRKDVYEIIELNGLCKIKINDWGKKGYIKIRKNS
jgi:hypothetical protein